MIKNYFKLLSLILIISGCAFNASGPLFSEAPPPNGDMGTLYVISSIAPFGMPVPIVKIDGKPFVKLGFKGYSYIYLKPGIYRLSFVSATTTIFMTEIEIKPDEELYEYFNPMYFSMSELTPSKAADFLKDYRYVVPINKEL